MDVCIVGAGRMGRVLAQRLSDYHNVSLHDTDSNGLAKVAELLGLPAVANLIMSPFDTVILAVPDSAVAQCIDELRKRCKPTIVFSVATNTTHDEMADLCSQKVRGLNVKIIGHAAEMNRGGRPVLIIDRGEEDLIEIAKKLFETVGTVIVGDADKVAAINTLATEEALKAAVAIENALRGMGIDSADMIRCAISHVAPGVMRAYAEDDLGPFARGVVCRLRDKS